MKTRFTLFFILLSQMLFGIDIEEYKRSLLLESVNDQSKCVYLDSICSYYGLKEKDSLALYSNQLLEVARRSNSIFHEAIAQRNFADIHFSYAEHEKADSIYRLVTKISGNKKTSAHAFFRLSLYRVHDKNFEESRYFIEEYKKVMGDDITPEILYRYHLILATIDFKKEDLANSLNSYLTALKYAYEENNSDDITIVLSNISKIYRALEAYESSNQYILEALDLSENDMIKWVLFLSVADNFIERERADSVHYYLDQAAEIYEREQYSFKGGLLYSIRSKAYILEKKYDLAKAAAEKGVRISQQEKSSQNKANCLLNLAQIDLIDKKYDSALQKIEQIEQLNGTYRSSDLYDLKARVYFGKKKWKKAYEYLDQKMIIEDSLYRNSAIVQTSNDLLAYRHEQDKKERQLITDKKERQLKQKVNNFKKILALVIGILLFAIGFLYLLNKWYREKKKSNELISQQKSELEKLNSFNNRLLYILGHDLRSPIGNIDTLFNEVLNKNISLDDFANILPFLKRSISGTNLTLNNILYWGLIQNGELKNNLDEISITDEIEHVQAFLSGLLRIKEIEFKKELDGDLVATTDKNKINLVIRNLISNSIKYTSKNGEIIVKGVQSDKGLTISIIDNGTGMSKENLAKLFKEQFSMDGTKNEKGTGIGLNLCKELVEELGGDITVESELGKGTSFHVFLPKIEDEVK